MKIFTGVSHAIRDTLLLIICVAIMLLTDVAMWLADEETVRKLKEKTNG